jgi:hypothetical protein
VALVGTHRVWIANCGELLCRTAWCMRMHAYRLCMECVAVQHGRHCMVLPLLFFHACCRCGCVMCNAYGAGLVMQLPCAAS